MQASQMTKSSGVGKDAAQIFKATALMERQLEESRIRLCQRDHFDFQETFKALDLKRDGKLFGADFVAFFAKHNVKHTVEECNLILLFQQKAIHEGISSEDFMELVLPHSDISLRNRFLVQAYDLDPEEKRALERDLLDLMLLELDFCMKIEKMTQDLTSTHGLEAAALVFNEMDTQGHGILGRTEFSALVQKYQGTFDEKDWTMLKRRIAIKNYLKEKLNRQELSWYLRPFTSDANKFDKMSTINRGDSMRRAPSIVDQPPKIAKRLTLANEAPPAAARTESRQYMPPPKTESKPIFDRPPSEKYQPQSSGLYNPDNRTPQRQGSGLYPSNTPSQPVQNEAYPNKRTTESLFPKEPVTKTRTFDDLLNEELNKEPLYRPESRAYQPPPPPREDLYGRQTEPQRTYYPSREPTYAITPTPGYESLYPPPRVPNTSTFLYDSPQYRESIYTPPRYSPGSLRPEGRYGLDNNTGFYGARRPGSRLF
eukprot:TRINITY_DN6175_c0_g1_i1.p1 TRINITY_DN6175_c0_g1~~TRINITY_DN6175_c0_g1_i1.p1  ORF type:complete len:484 (+),score=94.97 TRINITY_DN6175_c0_g1_i1:54-1505(+)